MRKPFSLLLISLFLLCTGNANAQTDTLPRVSDFVKEIQQVDDKGGAIRVVLWMPWQYWETAMLQTSNGQPLPQDVSDMISSMKQYNIFGVIDARPTPYGLTYTPEKTITDSARLTIGDSLKLRPVEEKSLPEEVRLLLGMLRPMMKQMLGQMGQNLVLLVFENTNSNGKFHADGRYPGNFSLSWNSASAFKWRLPLNVLIPPKYCPVDNEKHGGKFNYCPYHGNKLELQPTQPKK
jgi:hypothetical protein